MGTSTPGRGRRPRRSTRVSQNLERARQRNAEQLAQQKKREQLVEDGLVDFIDAGEIIAAEQASLADKIAVLNRKIEETRAESEHRVAGAHARQARAAWAIHEQGGRSAAQVAELLELRSEKAARALITAGRSDTGPGREQSAGRNGADHREQDSVSRGRKACEPTPVLDRPARIGRDDPVDTAVGERAESEGPPQRPSPRDPGS